MLKRTSAAVVGIGGLGTHVVQQLSHLGVGSLILIDNQELDKTNLNRYVGARHDDPISGSRKVDIAERSIALIDPAIHVQKVHAPLLSKLAFEAIVKADYVFGCLDNDSSRFILNELCSAYCLPYFDIASDIDPKPPVTYGGRVTTSWEGKGCLYCMGVLDLAEVRKELENPEIIREHDAIYGVNRSLLGETGPSVISVNGVVASLAVTEFTVSVTRIRMPIRNISYHGHLGKVTIGKEEPQTDCYYCNSIRGMREKARVERYLPDS